MKTKNIIDIVKKYYHICLIAIIIVVSFFLYSSNYYPLLNSDDAIIVLMTHYFHFPDDIFYWGQSRGGALTPMIGQVFKYVFHCRAITAVSLSNYTILLIGFLGLSSLFKNKQTKIMFAIIWFLPFQRFVDITRFYIAIEYSVLSIAIVLINRIWNKNLKTLKSQITLITIIFIFIISIWILYNALFSIIIMLCVLWFYRDKKKINKFEIIYFLSGVVFAFFILRYVYSFNHATCSDCNKINSFSGIIKSITILFSAYSSVLLFKTDELLVSIYSWLFILFLITYVWFLIKTCAWKIIVKDKWIMFFVLDCCAFFGIYLLSKWVYLNGMGRWYYVANYISLSIAILMSVDKLKKIKVIKYFRYAIMIIILIGAISPVYTMNHSNPMKLMPKDKVVSQFESLGEITIIAEWWNAYISSVSNPDKIKAIPHQDDYGYMRNIDLVKQAMKRNNIYLIKDMWMNSFPDTISEYGCVLVKDGKQMHLGDSYICRYRKITNNFSLPK